MTFVMKLNLFHANQNKSDVSRGCQLDYLVDVMLKGFNFKLIYYMCNETLYMQHAI